MIQYFRYLAFTQSFCCDLRKKEQREKAGKEVLHFRAVKVVQNRSTVVVFFSTILMSESVSATHTLEHYFIKAEER